MSISNVNHVVLTGRLTSDPDLRTLPSGAGVCRMRVAVNGRRRNAAGEWGEKPNFFDVVVYGVNGENVAKYLHTGSPVAIDGRLDWREWETHDGRKAQRVSVIAQIVQFLSSPPSSASDGFVPDDGAVPLHSIAGDEEEDLDVDDQEAIALAAVAS